MLFEVRDNLSILFSVVGILRLKGANEGGEPAYGGVEQL